MSRVPLLYLQWVPPPKRQHLPGADEALARVIAAHAKMRSNEEARAEAARERADAINLSIDLGLTLEEIGKHLGGVSRERVRQMRTAK